MNARAALVALLAVAAACGGDSVSGPAPGDAELTQVLAEMNQPSVGVAMSGVSGLPMSSLAPMASGSCSYAADSRSFVCPTVSMHGLTSNRSYMLLDVNGAPQAQYDVRTTDGVRSTMSTTGTIGPDSLHLAIDDHTVMTLTGLLSGRHVLNGVQVTDMSGKGMSPWSGSGTFTTHSVSTTRELVLPAAGELYPKSGTITMEMSSEIPGLSTETMRIQLTFDGTSRVDVATTFGGVTTHCAMDLSSRSPFCTSG